MDIYTPLILSGFLLLIFLTMAAVRYTSAGLLKPKSSSTNRRAKARSKQPEMKENHRWLRFLMVTATALAPLQAICILLHLLEILPYQNSIPVLTPTLGGVLATTLARWGSLRDLGVAGRTERTALLSALMVVNGVNLAAYTNLALTVLALSGFIALIWTLGLRLSDRLIGATSLLVVIWFALYSSGALYSLLPPYTQAIAFVLYLVNTAGGTLAVLLPALLVYHILSDKNNRLVFTLRLVSGLVLLGIAVYTAYQGAATAALRPYLAAAEYYPFTLLFSASVSGLLLASQQEKRLRLYGPAFAILVCLLLTTASNLGWVHPAIATTSPELVRAFVIPNPLN